MKQWDLDEFLEFVEEYLHDNGDCAQWIEQPFKDYDGIDIAVISVMQYEPPLVCRRVVGSNVRPLFRRCSRLDSSSPQLLAA